MNRRKDNQIEGDIGAANRRSDSSTRAGSVRLPCSRIHLLTSSSRASCLSFRKYEQKGSATGRNSAQPKVSSRGSAKTPGTAIVIILVAALVVIPLWVSPSGRESFRAPKLLLLRMEAILLIVALVFHGTSGKERAPVLMRVRSHLSLIHI